MELASDERARSRGCGLDPGCKGEQAQRVSWRREVAIRITSSAQLAQVLTESGAVAILPLARVDHGEKATAAGA